MNPRKLLWQFLLEHKGSYSLSLLSIIISEFITVQFPNLLGEFTDALQAGKMTNRLLLHYAILLALVGIAYVILYGIGQLWNGALGRQFEYLLRKRLFLHWELLSTTYFRHRSIGDLLNHAMTDVRQVREALSGGLNILTNAVFLLIATLYMTFRTVSVKLTLLSLIPLVFVPLFIVWFGPKVRIASRHVQEGLSDMAELTEESLAAIRLIKATGNEEIEEERFRKRVEEIVRRQMTMFTRSATFQSMIPLMGSIAFAIALLYGGWLALTRQIPLGSFVAFTLYLTMLIQPLQQIGFVINNFQRASASLLRLSILLGEKPEIQSPPEPQALEEVRGEIHVHLPAFQYADADEPTLYEIDFHLPAGRTLGIVGRTGSGKTTLVNLIPRIFDPPSGTVFLDGVDVRQLSLEALREAISYVPQDGFLFSTTIADNIRFGDSEASDEEVHAAARAAAIYEDVMDFPKGFETVIGERGVTLSGGQKQRTAIARALLKRAPVLILDDALSAVDMHTEKSILAELTERRRGQTNIIIAHRLSAVRHADHILVLDEGRVVEQGTHESLLAADGIYAQMYRLQEEEEAVG
ncbi:ABC transporter ATP-binding protein [Alicyclobacillus tolerans]|uniref:ATP-binding cassette subfamily B protein n=1 Tax=Alicyclobacillus tolerans TaxID=90970 RepID=A0ABT9LXR1_9BACL|nr:ABC transporter ATP-binding protein [Alicyclobacillus tengchongensis]MDP9729065.1 ATP-binding cassette subfamily B protein [Alicyclobacillus tengchongensis]